MVTITIPGKAVAQERPRFRRSGKPYYSDKFYEWQEHVRSVVKANMYTRDIPPFDQGQPLCLECAFYFIRPKSVSKKNRLHPTVRPDSSNLLKVIEDSLNGILWYDDAQIVDTRGSKWYRDKDEVIVSVIEI